MTKERIDGDAKPALEIRAEVAEGIEQDVREAELQIEKGDVLSHGEARDAVLASLKG